MFHDVDITHVYSTIIYLHCIKAKDNYKGYEDQSRDKASYVFFHVSYEIAYYYSAIRNHPSMLVMATSDYKAEII